MTKPAERIEPFEDLHVYDLDLHPERRACTGRATVDVRPGAFGTLVFTRLHDTIVAHGCTWDEPEAGVRVYSNSGMSRMNWRTDVRYFAQAGALVDVTTDGQAGLPADKGAHLEPIEIYYLKRRRQEKGHPR